MADEIKAHVGDVGLILKPTVKDETDTIVSIATATVLTIKLEDPFGVVTSKTASLFTDGTDGILKYATLAADLHTAGRWVAQGYVEMTGRKFHTAQKVFTVEGNLT
jgi:hypothetical protein